MLLRAQSAIQTVDDRRLLSNLKSAPCFYCDQVKTILTVLPSFRRAWSLAHLQLLCYITCKMLTFKIALIHQSAHLQQMSKVRSGSIEKIAPNT